MSTEDHIPLYLITTPEESTLWWLSIVSDRCEHLVASATSWIDTLCLSPSSKQPTPKSRVDETARYGLRWSVLLFHLENILVSTESSHWRSLKFFEDSARMLSAKISAHPRLATMSETTSAASRAASWWKIRVPLDIEKSELACVGTNSLRLYFRLYQLFQLAAYAKRPTSAKNPTQIQYQNLWVVFSINSLVFLCFSDMAPWLCHLLSTPVAGSFFLNHCSSTVTVPEFPQWRRGNGSSKYCASDLCYRLRLLVEVGLHKP